MSDTCPWCGARSRKNVCLRGPMCSIEMEEDSRIRGLIEEQKKEKL